MATGGGFNTSVFVQTGTGGGIPPSPPTQVRRGKTLIVSTQGYSVPLAARQDVVYHFNNINQALAAANDGDVVIIYPGTWNLTAPIPNKTDLSIHCFPGVTITGTSIFSAVGRNFKMTGDAVINDDADLFNQRQFSSTQNVYIEVSDVSCWRILVKGTALFSNGGFIFKVKNIIKVREYILFLSNFIRYVYFEFDKLEYIDNYLAGQRFVVANLDDYANVIVRGNILDINADSFSTGAGVYQFTGPLTGTTLNRYLFNVDIKINKTIIRGDNGGINIFGVRVSELPNIPYDYDLRQFGYHLRTDFIIDGAQARAIVVASGAMYFSGNIFYQIDDVVNHEAIALNNNLLDGGGSPMLYLEKTGIWINSDCSGAPARGVISMNDQGNSPLEAFKLILDNVKIKNFYTAPLVFSISGVNIGRPYPVKIYNFLSNISIDPITIIAIVNGQTIIDDDVE